MKKIISKITVAVLAVALVLSFAGCGGGGDDSTSSSSGTSTSDHTHSVSEWEVVEEATCSSTGLKQGYCGICYNLITEETPIDPDNHTYGEWNITAPTMTSSGVAVKVCVDCGKWLQVTLPVLTDSAVYTSKVTVRPTASSKGESQYTYHHEEGDIVFTVELDAGGIQTVPDAVSVGSSSESHELVRSASGTRGDLKTESVITDTVLDGMSKGSFSYEMYDGYTLVEDTGGFTYHMGLDGNEIYGYMVDNNGTVTTVSNTSYYNGFAYYETYTDALSTYYGTENFLAGIYEYGKANGNGDFEEGINADGSYYFSFGSCTVYSGGLGGALLSLIEVTFTLTENYTIDSLYYYSVTYENGYTVDDQGNIGEFVTTFEYDDEQGGYKPITYYGTKYVEQYEVTQTEKADGDIEKENPYSAEKRFYTDFDITYNGEVIDDSTSIELIAGTSSGTVFAITNLTPSDAMGDTINFYYRQYSASGSSYTDTLVNYGTEASVGILIYVDSSNKFYIKSNITGDVTIVAKSRNVSKEFTINFISAAPSELHPTVYEYSSSLDGYVANTTSQTSTTATVYVGQPLYYNVALLADEQGKCTETFTTTVANTALGEDVDDYYSVSEAVALETTSGDQVSVSMFTATTAGTYTLTLASTEDEDVTCTITVTVENIPDFSEVFNGTYTGTFADSGNTITVTFDNSTISTTYSVYDGVTVYTSTINGTITYGGISGLTIAVTYSYYIEDNTVYVVQIEDSDVGRLYGAVEMLQSEMVLPEGTTEDDLDEEIVFRITFNEAFNLTINHSLGEDYDGAIETVVLKKA